MARARRFSRKRQRKISAATEATPMPICIATVLAKAERESKTAVLLHEIAEKKSNNVLTRKIFKNFILKFKKLFAIHMINFRSQYNINSRQIFFCKNGL